MATIDFLATEQDVKKIFKKLQACSRTYFYLLNREFGNNSELEELASFQLAGGILALGHQCGMLWGASMAVGLESYLRRDSMDQAINMTVLATQEIIKSFVVRTKTVKCKEITNCDFSSKLSLAKYFITGRYKRCFNLAEVWAPEAIEAAKNGMMLQNKENQTTHCLSCASEVARKMGATDEEMVIVSGFAGGLGLSGNACGALSAAIWMKSLEFCRQNPEKNEFPIPAATHTLSAFKNATKDKILCKEISQRVFDSVDDHTAYINNGGCNKLLEALASS